MKNLFILIILSLVALGCVTEYSPYETTLNSSEINQTRKNRNELYEIERELGNTKESYSFALISDSHTYFDDLEKTVKEINKNPEISFVFHLGDLTSDGLKREYLWTFNILKKLKKPFLTSIGNHDFLNNGKKIYKWMFGDLDYTFSFMNDRFIVVNTNPWASSDNVPDFEWLETELKASKDFDHVFVLSHIPPFGDQFNAEKEETYRALVKQHNVDYSIHGHVHGYFKENFYNDGIPYITVDTVKHRNYIIINVSEEDITVERIIFN